MKFLLGMALIVGITLLNGWVIVTMWGWYILPLGAPDITFAHGLGIGALVSFIARAQIIDDDDQQFERIFTAIAMPLLTILMGWIISFWM